MDFDERFSLEEFQEHIYALDDETDIPQLITRTTKNTRGGDAFSFKPTHMWIGTDTSHGFSSDFECEVDSKGPNPQRLGNADLEDYPWEIDDDKEQPSSFWLRFNELGERFQFRIFCRRGTIPSLLPYEGILPYKDLIPGGIKLHAQPEPCVSRDRKSGRRVVAQLTIRSRRPPRTIVRLVPVLRGRDPIFDRQTTEADFFRGSEDESINEESAGILSPLGSPRAIVKPGLWLTHRFQFSLTIRHYKLLWQCMIRLRLIELNPVIISPKISLPLPDMLNSCISPSETGSFVTFPFELRYLVEGLISCGIISEAETESLYEALQPYPSTLWPLLLQGLFKWTGTMSNVQTTVEEVATCVGPAPPVPPHYIMVLRCLVTPLRCLLRPPQQETSNSMLRAFDRYRDRFLRVQFTDEDGSGLPVTAETLDIDEAMGGSKGIFARLRRAMQYGLRIGNRHYVFLCFGESQIKERGCWMISEDNDTDFTVRNVLDWMGDLTEERNVAKHAARQGLALSTTRAAALSLTIKHDLPDIVSTNFDRTYTFTDGVGHCSQLLANRCSAILGHDFSQVAPSAVQVRIGGSKGVLCVVPDVMIEENTIRLRKSMIKFKSTNTTLNVLKVATYGVAYLNRQAILLLEALGIPSDVLLRIFQEEKHRAEGLGKGRVIEEYEGEFQVDRLGSLTTFPLARAILAGFTDDPLVQNILRVLKCRLLGDLKWKARVEVAEGAYLMGVADETRTLQEGEIFCQVDCPSGRRIVTGMCTVFRNPCLHPGDLRLVKAVNCPLLSNYSNVIVFSTSGRRDLPSMMGGGDLDGDHYTVLWDKRLIIPREHEAMDYINSAQRQILFGRPIDVEDTKNFFLDYIMNDILGMICNAHMALADCLDDGPHHPDCISLAQMASQAVDFNKTGIRVERDSYVRPNSYPDFMGKEEEMMLATKNGKKKKAISTHKSDKVLGEMFRSIAPDPVFDPVGLNDINQWNPPFRTMVLNWSKYIDQAALLKARYDFQLNGLLRTYNICEAECVAGVLLRSRKRRVRVERDYSHRVAVREAYENIQLFFVSEATEYLSRNSVTGNRDTDRAAWALACYKITYDKSYSRYLESVLGASDSNDSEGEEGDSDREEEEEVTVTSGLLPVSEQRYSFGWLFHDEIVKMSPIRA